MADFACIDLVNLALVHEHNLEDVICWHFRLSTIALVTVPGRIIEIRQAQRPDERGKRTGA